MLIRREDLTTLGGFQALAPYIGDDYELGRRIAGLGRRIVLSDSVVQTSLGAGSWRSVWRHQLRWSRTIRAARPAGHAGLFFTHGTIWSLLLLATAGGAVALTALALGCLSLRILVAWQVAGRTLNSPSALRHTILAIPGDLLGVAVWIASFFGRQVFWRGRWLRLGKNGRIIQVGAEAESRHGSPTTAPVRD
jgi:ceramide glucosyltransferase